MIGRTRWRGMALLLARLLLGGVLLKAGLAKVGEPSALAETIGHFGLVPLRLVTLLAVWIPWLECIVGGCLLAGLLSASAALLAAGMTLSFGLAVTSALLRGLDIACGCFGSADTSHVQALHVAMDALLFVVSVCILCQGPGLASLDGFLALQGWGSSDSAAAGEEDAEGGQVFL